MQGLVYILIALTALGIGAAGYFGLTFTPIEGAVTALCVAMLGVLAMERRLRIRAETRLDRAIEDLARLLSTDARAGQVLSQRVNAMADTNVGNRLDAMEADVSVLGTVVRQVAEAVAEMQTTPPPVAVAAAGTSEAAVVNVAPDPVDDDMLPEPIIPPHQLEAALDRGRLVFHIQPIVQLPQRRAVSYDLVPRLMLDDGSLADPPDFLPRRGSEALLRRIELMALNEAVAVVRRARMANQPLKVWVPLSRATFTDRRTLDSLLGVLVANQAMTDLLGFTLDSAMWSRLGSTDKRLVFEIRKTGVSFAMADAASLRFDYAELETLGFGIVRFDAQTFLRQPASLTDLHTADVAAFVRRFSIELCATAVVDEQQLLGLFEDGITLAQGPHLGRPGSVRPEMSVELPAARRGALS